MRRVHLVALLACIALGAEARGIEMFTYFGDGSRIGLPSLEVPIEAYPGIPLRSDRIRARRRAQRSGTAVRVGPGTPVGNVTIRPMPTQAMPAAVAEPIPAPRPTQPPSSKATSAKNTSSRPAAD